MQIDELRRRVTAIQWFHTIDLGNGVVTSGVDASPQKLQAIGMPPDLTGKSVLDISLDNIGMFDVVLFLGVLYHMQHPLLVLEKVSMVTGGMLILETHVDLTVISRPAMAFYPGAELGMDTSNWCGPNEACVIAMLKEVGFKKVEVHSRTYKSVALSPDPKSLEEVQTNRAVFHAWK